MLRIARTFAIQMESNTKLDREQLAALPRIESPEGLGWIDDFEARTALLHGWAADPVTESPARSVFVLVDGKVALEFSGTYGTARPDVAAYHKNKALTAVGLVTRVPMRTLAPGGHSLQLGVVSSDGKGYYLVPVTVEFFVSG
jgi:hypothetical protein